MLYFIYLVVGGILILIAAKLLLGVFGWLIPVILAVAFGYLGYRLIKKAVQQR